MTFLGKDAEKIYKTRSYSLHSIGNGKDWYVDAKNKGGIGCFLRAIKRGFVGECFNEGRDMFKLVEPGLIWGYTFHVLQMLYELNKEDEEMKILLSTYLTMLENQADACAAGGVGRNFQIVFQAYCYLLNQYEPENI